MADAFDRTLLSQSENVLKRAFSGGAPKTAIVLGTGWKGAVEGLVERHASVGFEELAALGASGVSGHAGEVVFGSTRSGQQLLLFCGRRHWYELYDPSALTALLAIPYLTRALGARRLIACQGVGGVTAAPGGFVVISDLRMPESLNLFPCGANDLFVDEFARADNLFSSDLIAVAESAAKRLGLSLPQAVYHFWPAKQFQSRADIRAVLHEANQDKLSNSLERVIGKSLAPEAFYAKQLDLEVLGLCAVLNYATGIADGGPDHELHKRVGRELEAEAARLLSAIVAALG